MLILITGNDRYRITLAAERELAALRLQHGTALSVVRISGDEPGSTDALLRPLRYPSLVAGHTAIIVTNAAHGDVTATLEEGVPSDVTVLAVQHTVKPAANLKKSLGQLQHIADRAEAFDTLTGAERLAWIGQFCRARDCRIQRAAATLADERSGGDTWALALLLDQLCAFVGPDADIGTDTVLTLTHATDAAHEWALTDALFSGDKRGTLAALWRTLHDGTPPQLVLGMAASATRALLAARTAPQAAGPLGIHPFVASKAARGARYYQEDALRRTHLGLAALDRDSKDGRTDIVDGLFRVLLEL